MGTPSPVRVLSDALINKIAAGEVIERPASVVKELVENAVDAGATRVRVEVRSGGKTLISVQDDGQGMGRDDALLAIERHATSKIRASEDLFSIHTLGFRGEALPAIAQVSRTEIRTARAGDQAGTLLSIDGGVLKDVRDAPPVPGTEVHIRRLFFNTPVRLRFLRGDRTELGHVTEAVTRLALARPDIDFELYRGDQEVFRAPASGELPRRVGDLLGGTVERALRPVQHLEGEVTLRGLVGGPELTRSARNGLYLFVNGRPVRDRLLLGAVLSSYRGVVPKGRFPVVVLFLELPADQVDHNVHPTKSEVRFVQSQRIYRLVADAVAAALRSDLAAPPQPAAPQPATPPPPPERGPSRARGAGTPSWGQVRESLFDALRETPAPAPAGAEAGAEVSDQPDQPDQPDHPVPAREPPPPSSVEPAVERPLRYADLRYLGAYDDTFLLFQYGADLVVLDQHAAHERINYEKILRGIARGSGRSGWSGNSAPAQGLLVPEVIDLPRAHAQLLLSHVDALVSLGIEIADFGGGSVAVTAAPPALQPAQVRTLIGDLAQELLQVRPSTAVDELRHRIAALAACHASVRAHDHLTPDEVQALLRGLDQAEMPYTCPHGRPLLVRFGRREVEKWFHRS